MHAPLFFGGRKKEVGRFPPGYSDGHPFFISDPLVSMRFVGCQIFIFMEMVVEKITIPIHLT